MGPIEPCRPKLRGADERFCLQLFGLGVTRTTALEARDVSAQVRGPIGPQRRGRPAGGPRRRDDSVALHSELDLPGAPGRVRRLLRPRSRLSVSTTCSGTVRTSSATSTRPPSRCSSPGASTPTGSPVSSGSCPPPRSRRTPEAHSSRVASKPPRPATHRRLRRDALAHRGDQAGLPAGPAPVPCDPPLAQRRGEGLGGRPGLIQVRVVGGLRSHHRAAG